jgi:hypothetical protein
LKRSCLRSDFLLISSNHPSPKRDRAKKREEEKEKLQEALQIKGKLTF